MSTDTLTKPAPAAAPPGPGRRRTAFESLAVAGVKSFYRD
jgi:hypothetical protein